MPRYDYVCDNCGTEVELNLPVDDRGAPLHVHSCTTNETFADGEPVPVGDHAHAGLNVHLEYGRLKRRWAPTPFLGVHIFGSARAPRNRT